MSSPESALLAQQPRLLRLPAELRNLIYSYVAEPSWTNIRLVPPPYSIHTSHNSPKHGLFWSKYLRKSLGLTQTCRQLRGEFLPVHRAAVAVTIREKHTEFYVSTFFPCATKAGGTLFVDTCSSHYVSLLPLIRLDDRAPNVSIKFYLSPADDDALLEKIGPNRKFAGYALKSATDITFVFGEPTRLCIEVKPEAEENWMPSPNRLDNGSDFHFAALNWRKQVGLRNLGFDMQHIYVTVAKDEVGIEEGKEHGVASDGKEGGCSGNSELSLPVRARWD